MQETLLQWIEDNHLSVNFLENNILEIQDVGKFLIIQDQEKTFDDRFILNLTDKEIDQIDNVDYLLYKFGSFWFYSHKDDESNNLNFFRYLGKPKQSSFELPFLSVHGKYEICNGSRDYTDWVKKAKFLGFASLGICESQTLAGNFYFQKACDKGGIKAIHGRTNKVKSNSGSFYYVKSYVKNINGWKDLLRIHNIEIITRHVDGKYITEDELFQLSGNLINIISHETDLEIVDLNKFDLENTFFQFNIVEYNSNEKDKEHLHNLKKYVDNYLNIIKPIVLQDAYYLDKNDDIVKPLLNKVIGKTSQFSSKEEYLKPFEQIFEDIDNMFSNKDLLSVIMNSTFEAYDKINNECKFVLKREGRHLPKYLMNEDEKQLYSSNEDMFFGLIEKGFKEFILDKNKQEDIYIERLQKEIQVLQDGDVVDYFLILYDIATYTKKYTGINSIGRGSAAGSLVSYLLGVTQLDPIEYNLLFERFLTEGRLQSGSLPDIDYDCPSFFRQSVIDYIIQKYGKEQVACIGTAQNFKLKSTIKDLLKLKGVDFATANIVTSLFTKEYDNASIEGIFELAKTEKRIRDIISKYPEIIYEIYLMIFQPRSLGIHAAGVIIAPSEDENGNKTTIHDYVPCRLSDGQYVTEWEKDAVEDAGMLKEDILGLTQLDKIIRMNTLIKENNKEYFDYQDINIDDKKVIELFKEGITEDIFQFNTDVQKNYLLQLNPDNVKDLIAANALNRPGAMENNSHNKFIKYKHGIEEPFYPPLLEEILKDTYGLYSFQEQAMLSFQIISESSLEESDNFRKVITKLTPGKKNPDIEKYEKIFKDAYFSKINNQEIVNKVWDMIIGFANYGFNLSHAASYALTGYWAAYYKTYFPVEFYTTSLEMSTADTLKRIINEIQSRQLVNLSHPDINKSADKYSIDYENNTIYWSLSSIKYAGIKSISTLLDERSINGQYFSFEEFLNRSKGFKVNKRIITNFILCGAFDNIENIQEAKDRYKLLKTYYVDFLKEKVPEDISQHRDNNKNHFWILLQRQLCGLGNIDFEAIYKSKRVQYFTTTPFLDPYLVQEEENIEKGVVVGGILEQIIERNTKNGLMCQMMLNCNNEILKVIIWPDVYIKLKDIIMDSMYQPILINGHIKKDSYKNNNMLQTHQYTTIVK